MYWSDNEANAKASATEAIQSGALRSYCVRIESATRIGYARIWASSLEEATNAAKHAMRPGYQLIDIWLDQ